MSLSDIKDVATLAGVITGTISLVYTAISISYSQRVNSARFWLDLRERFARHDPVHRRLRPGGAWSGGAGPTSADEWAEVEAYMGLFEHCEVMLRQKLIDEQTFKEIYGYRLNNIVANDSIRKEKLVRLASGWQRFIELLKRFRIEVK